MLEGLEVDQFMWSIIQVLLWSIIENITDGKIFVNFQHSSCTEAEEVQVDAQANVKPIFLKTEGGTIQVTDAAD